MAGKEDNRIFVGGLSLDITERQLQRTFSRFGDILDCQIMLERDTGRPRGFGFITFADRRGVEESMREMHGRELGDRVISVNRAQPKAGSRDDVDTYGGSRGDPGKGSYGRGGVGGVGGGHVGEDECFKCGRVGHWARDCPSAATGGRGGPLDSLSSRPRFGGSSGRMDRYDTRDRFVDREQYVDSRYDGDRFGDRDRFDERYSFSGRDRHVPDRYPPAADRFGADRYGGGNGYGKGRAYDRDIGGPRGGNDRFGGPGPVRDEGKSYRSRPGPYDRPSRAGGAYPALDRY